MFSCCRNSTSAIQTEKEGKTESLSRTNTSQANLVRRTSVYFDSAKDSSDIQECIPSDDDSEIFMDAVQDLEDMYPIITTSYIPPAPRRVSMLEPDSMLRATHLNEPDTILQAKPVQQRLRLPPVLEKRSSSRATRKAQRRPTAAAKQDLVNPHVVIQERGYPGQLSNDELAQAQKFYRAIHGDDAAVRDIVYSLNTVEEEPYAICRFLRATQFDADKIVQRLQDGLDLWKDASAANFYPDLSDAIGAPVPVFLQFYPYCYFGTAKNGCPVSYFKAGRFDVEGLLAMTTTDKTASYFWHSNMYSFRDLLQKTKESQPEFVRCEAINVIDLTGLSASQFSNDTMDALKIISKIGDYFPETMHCLIVLNAPTWFSMTWRIIQGFIDPRTAKKIQVFGSETKGRNRLFELVDESEVPTDFGGKAGSTDLTIRKLAFGNDWNKRRLAVDLMHVKRNGKSKTFEWTLNANEEMTQVQVFSRSVTPCSITLTQKGGAVVADQVAIERPHGNTTFTAAKEALPFVTTIPTANAPIRGPGTFTVEASDNKESSTVNKKLPSGFFLFVADIRQTE
jgi:hypothetical protein